VINDHGGVIEFDTQPRRTTFRVYLPVAPTAVVTPSEKLP
jgi:two-component system nitrogen regulation sensor histidine kinase GlnL